MIDILAVQYKTGLCRNCDGKGTEVLYRYEPRGPQIWEHSRGFPATWGLGVCDTWRPPRVADSQVHTCSTCNGTGKCPAGEARERFETEMQYHVLSCADRGCSCAWCERRRERDRQREREHIEREIDRQKREAVQGWAYD